MALPIDEMPLQVVCVGDPVLRAEARELSLDEIRSPETQNLIELMKKCMHVSKGIGLAAPQIGKSIQLIVYEDVDQSFLSEDQIRERNRKPIPFHVLINPRITRQADAATEFYEGCLSVPGYMAMVRRAEAIRVQYLNEKGESVDAKAEGWYARGLQHEIDHLHGILYIDRMIPSTLTNEENYKKFWKAGTQKSR